MKRLGIAFFIAGIAAAIPTAADDPAANSPAQLEIDFPADGSIFPPEITPPAFLWRDSAQDARAWVVEVEFGDGAAGLRVKATAEHPRIGEVDGRAVSSTNELPILTPRMAASWTWTPDGRTWAAIKARSVTHPAKVTITGFRDRALRRQMSRGAVTIRTSRDPVGAPIFYRDVPLMPSETEKGIIKPLAQAAVPLIAWRLRNIGESHSRTLLEGMHTCANCHSFSADGRTLGMDLDGPQNDKGLYAIVPVQPRTTIRSEDVISWKSFQEQAAGPMRVGFMSQVSPDGRYVLTTVGVEKDLTRNYYVANFKDYRFLQVFYPTRGVLAWLNRATGQRQSLPGADDPRYVQTNGVWSPDGKYIVFARAEGQDAYPPGRPIAERANDPNEAQVKYDLYRVPFNDGKGGEAERIVGASRNGMSNSFPKVSPDGRWIVFVQAKNGLLMRPDSQLYIVPAAGGEARRMNCNASPMNSWHSFSPNGRWLVFSSKRSSPYTRMYLTHIDENGNDSPAIPIDNATAANRAVNIPEFVNVPQDGLLKMDAPAAEFYTLFDIAWALAEKGAYKEAISAWNAALALDPNDAKAQNNLGFALARENRLDEAILHWRKAVETNDEYTEVHRNLGGALLEKGELDEAIAHLRKAVANPQDAKARASLGAALVRKGNLEEAMANLRSAIELDPADAGAHYNLGLALLKQGKADDAAPEFERAVQLDPRDAQFHNDLGVALSRKSRFDEAIVQFSKAVAIDSRFSQAYFNLGNAYYLQKKIPDAVAQWLNGLRLEPGNLAVLRQVAWTMSTTPDASVRNGGEAVNLAERAVEISGGQDPAILDTLAAACAEAGRFAEAVQTARKALALAVEQKRQPLAVSIGSRLAMYEKGVPFRDAPR